MARSHRPPESGGVARCGHRQPRAVLRRTLSRTRFPCQTPVCFGEYTLKRLNPKSPVKFRLILQFLVAVRFKPFAQRCDFRYPELVMFTERFLAVATRASVAGYPVPSWSLWKLTFRVTVSLASSIYVATVRPITRLLAGSTS